MEILSDAFENMGKIPKKYTCDGDNISPPLLFENIPKKAKSLALIVDDPDAPAGTWTHWIMWNIDPQKTGIAENSIPPEAVEGTTNFGKPGYGGPCPPMGEHRYFFKLYALDCEIKLPDSASVSNLEKEMENHILDKAEIYGTYERR